MSHIPSKEECLSILMNEGCSREVIEHCLAVEKLAVKIGMLCDANLELISAGSLLHDVGRSVTHGIWHPVKGVEILERLAADEKVVAIVRKHLGAGLTREEAEALGFPQGDYMPSTLEEKIVTYADNVVGDPARPDRRKTGKEAADELAGMGFPEASRRALALHDELCELCKMDIDKL